MTAGILSAPPRWSALLLALAFATGSGGAAAAACDGVPLCQKQEKGAVTYGPLDTKGWAYYCTGDHPFYWNNSNSWGFGIGNNFSSDNGCFSISENMFAEGSNPTKFDATITNWCLKHETLKITLGCSMVNPTGPACKGSSYSTIKDPHCPMVSGTTRNTCSGGQVPVCVQTWEEKCATSSAYCTDNQGLVWCLSCPN